MRYAKLGRVLAFVFICILACASLAACVSPITNADTIGESEPAHISPIPNRTDAYEPGELLVGLTQQASETPADVQSAIQAIGHDASTVLCGQVGGTAVLLVKTSPGHQTGQQLLEGAHAIAAIPGVAFVQPNYRYVSAAAEASDAVKDPAATRQQYLNSWLTSSGANVAEAWSLMPDSAAAVDVAVLDTGMYSMADYTGGSLVADDPENFHQEFDAENLDMADARDFVHTEGGEPLPLVNANNPHGDDNGHGTHVAGIIAAGSSLGGKQAMGMAGIAQNARIIPLKVLDSGGSGDTESLIRAYEYLLEGKTDGRFAQLRVINLSASLTFADDGADDDPATDADGGDEGDDDIEFDDDEEPVEFIDGDTGGEDEALHQVIQTAREAGVVTVCAAGNEASGDSSFPGDYDECICVMALDANGGIADFSNANDAKDIAAPGTDIYSAWATQADAYTALNGTSQATAIVSGVLALMWGANPDMAPDEAEAVLYETTWPLNGAAGNGAIDAGASLQLLTTGSFEKEVPVPPATSTPIDKAKVTTAKKTYAYTGKKLTPTVTVTLNGKTLKKGTDYTVAYASNKNPGKAKITIKGTGAYSGSATASFKIKPAPTKIKKLREAEEAFTVSWKQQKKGKVRYQIRYSLKKNMKAAKKKTVKKNSTTKLKVGNLKSDKRYYVQVRTYKKIGGKTYYSKWSAKKSVKVR